MIPTRRPTDTFQEGDNLFLEMKLLKLDLLQPVGVPVKICVYKGLQKLDQTCLLNIGSQNEFVIDESTLNFHIRDFQKKKNIIFKITLQTQNMIEQELGSFDIQVNNFVVPYIKDGVNSFQREDYLTQNVQLEYMLFMEKTKTDVEKSLKSYEASKKSLNYVDNGNQWTITSPAYSQKQSRVITRTKIQNSEHIPHNITPGSKRFTKAPLFRTASQKEQLQNLSNKQDDRLSNKIWFQMQNGEQIVNNLVFKPSIQNAAPVTSASSSTALNIKIIGVLAVLGVLAYLIMLLDDMNYGMDLVRSTIEAQIRQNQL